MLKKLTWLAVLLLMLGFCALATAEQSGSCGTGVTYRLDNNGLLTISGQGGINYHPWIKQNVKQIVIEPGVTSICNSAFKDCINLSSATLPEGMSVIDSSAFEGCNSLTDILFPKSVIKIGNSAFSGCISLANISLSFGLNKIGDNAFYKCALTSITIPESVTHIGEYSFSFCGNLTSVTMPERMVSIGKGAFNDCSKLKNITIPKGISSIESFSFYGCSSLKSVTIPDSVTSIGYCAFEQCSSLAFITIPESITSIDSSAFYGCNNLKDICFLSQSTEPISIDEYAFSSATSNTKISCFAFTYIDLWATENNFQTIYLDMIDPDTIREIVLPENFSMIGGETIKLPIYVFPDDKSEITWSSSDPSIVTVNNGIITTFKPGTATVIAKIGSVSATVNITVFVYAVAFDLYPEEAWLIGKESVQIEATNYSPADSIANITWSSSDNSIASVDQTGLVKTTMLGDVIISADTEQGVHRECLLHIYYPVTAIEFEPIVETIVPGQDVALTANVTMRTQNCINHLVTFSSSDEHIATVDENGVMHTLDEGEVSIIATAASGVTSKITLVIDHNWSAPVYEWSEDNSSVTARRICKHNVDHIEEETVLAIEEMIVAPTCTEEGMANYTSEAFCNPLFEVQRKVQTPVAKLGHDWSEPSYTWNENWRQVTASRICARDESHIETETSRELMIGMSFPTETRAGSATFSVRFNNRGFSTQTRELDIPALKDMTILTVPAQLNTIDEEAFVGISSQAVIIRGSCEQIGRRAFANCPNLIYIQVPTGVVISQDAFEGCGPMVMERK